MNGEGSGEDGEDEPNTDRQTPNGVVVRDGRSVSSTLHDRNRTPSGAGINPASSSKSSGRHQHTHHTNSPLGSSPQTARDSFMSYFFGQSGAPGPSTAHAGHTSQTSVSTMGRAFAEAGGNAVDNMHGLRNSLDGSNPAYDMKSLEKHIEAVSSVLSCSLPFC